jgi:hypothetical protein
MSSVNSAAFFPIIYPAMPSPGPERPAIVREKFRTIKAQIVQIDESN